METRQLGQLWPVSALTLGGGGLGQVWGPTTREEAVATVKAAVDAGITLLDLAPGYGKGEAENVVGEAFNGKIPEEVRITTKCWIGTIPVNEIYPKFERSLKRSLETIKRDHVDLFFLHSLIHPEDYVFQSPNQEQFGVPWSHYLDGVIPAMEKLKAEGRIGNWGITGTGLPKSIMEALRHDPKPAVVQAIANLMDSPGDMQRYEEPPEPRNIIRTAKNNDVGVLGIRAVQAGALTAKFDREVPPESKDAQDYEKAASFRKLCAELGEDPADLATLYALAMENVDTVILGVKNRQELNDIIKAEAKGPLDKEIIKKIDALGLARQRPRMPID